jgi:hypothetical protein
MASRSYLWSVVSILLFLLSPIAPAFDYFGRVARYAWDVAFAPVAELWRPRPEPVADVGPLQRTRARAFLERRARRMADFLPAGCPDLIAA